FLIATFWNFAHVGFTGLSALSYPRQIGGPAHRQSKYKTVSAKSEPINGQLLSAAVRLNVWISALGLGLGFGLLLFLGTNMSVMLSQRPGRYLNLLGVFMPGYSASIGGAWVGLLWGTIYGAIFGYVLIWLHARNTR